MGHIAHLSIESRNKIRFEKSYTICLDNLQCSRIDNVYKIYSKDILMLNISYRDNSAVISQIEHCCSKDFRQLFINVYINTYIKVSAPGKVQNFQ